MREGRDLMAEIASHSNHMDSFSIYENVLFGHE